MAGSHGHFELNVFKPLIAHNILQSIDLIADSTKNFALYCVRGIKANKKKIFLLVKKYSITDAEEKSHKCKGSPSFISDK